jgi:phosphoglycerate dehydrogenase-like enzyme
VHIAIYHPELGEEIAGGVRKAAPEAIVDTCSNEVDAKEFMETCEILVAHKSFPTNLLSQAENLKWIQALSAGVESWLPDLPANVRFSRLTGSFGPRMAEFAIGYILAITQRIPEVLSNQRSKVWQPLELNSAFGKTLGVAGLGKIGSAVAHLGSEMGMKTAGFSKNDPGPGVVDQWYSNDDWDNFLSNIDFLVLALPVTPETRHIINEDSLSKLGDQVWLVNIARGDLIDEEALIRSLKARRPAGAVLDVFSEEPLDSDSPLWTMDNVIVTPHHSGANLTEEMIEIVVSNLERYESNASLINEVDLSKGY